MTLRQFLFIMTIATLTCWISWMLVVSQIDPAEGMLGIVLFYLTWFFSLLGTFFLISFAWRKLFSKYDLDYKMVGTSFRQSIFFALLFVGIMYLQSKNMLTWWNIVLIVLALVVIEGFTLSLKRKI